MRLCVWILMLAFTSQAAAQVVYTTRWGKVHRIMGGGLVQIDDNDEKTSLGRSYAPDPPAVPAPSEDGGHWVGFYPAVKVTESTLGGDFAESTFLGNVEIRQHKTSALCIKRVEADDSVAPQSNGECYARTWGFAYGRQFFAADDTVDDDTWYKWQWRVTVKSSATTGDQNGEYDAIGEDEDDEYIHAHIYAISPDGQNATGYYVGEISASYDNVNGSDEWDINGFYYTETQPGDAPNTNFRTVIDTSADYLDGLNRSFIVTCYGREECEFRTVAYVGEEAFTQQWPTPTVPVPRIQEGATGDDTDDAPSAVYVSGEFEAKIELLSVTEVP